MLTLEDMLLLDSVGKVGDVIDEVQETEDRKWWTLIYLSVWERGNYSLSRSDF